MSVSVTLNGRAAELPEGRSLLHALREDLGLKGTRFGCGEESCGACHVIADGEVRPSCTLATETLEGAVIETVEALGPPEAPAHPLGRAVLEGQAAQCGYCLPGILMTAKALLDRDPNPDEAAIRTALDGNICRCGAHLRILAAVRRAAAEMAAT